MAQVAAGRADCYTEYGVHVWDIAAGYLLVREAGGVVVDTNGRCARTAYVYLIYDIHVISFFSTKSLQSTVVIQG